MKIDNIEIKTCTSFISRLKGLMFQKKINYGLLFPKCNSVHSFFMKEKIDVFMTDINGNVLYVKRGFKPFRIILPKKNVYYTFEFPEGKIKNKTNLFNK